MQKRRQRKEVTDEKFLDIRDKVYSIEFCNIEVDKTKELKEYESFLNKEIDRYYKVFNKANNNDLSHLSKGIKNKLTGMMSLLYRIENLLENCK